MSDELAVAIEAAKRGAKVGLKYYNSSLKALLKNDKTIITKADFESEKEILSYISSKYPSANFVAEERGGSTNKKTFWTVDPIDGSRSFSRGIPSWCVLISFCSDKLPILGVCYFPILDVLIYSEKGKGAYINGKRIKVSSIDKLNLSYLGYGSPRHFKNKQIIIDLIEAAGSARSFDATYSHYLLADGKIDVYVDMYGKIWDIAPFKVITEEAGGKITQTSGAEWNINSTGCVATNGILHNEILAIVNKRK